MTPPPISVTALRQKSPFSLRFFIRAPRGIDDWILLGLLGAVAVFVAFAPLLWTPVAVAAIIGGITLLRYPWIIWVVLGAVLPWTSGMRVGILSITDIILLLAVMLWFMDAVRRRQVRVHISGPAVAALAYVVVLYLAAFQAVDLTAAAIQVIKWLQFTVILLLIPTMLHAERHIPWLVSALFIGATAQALLGIYQFYFRIGPEWFLIQGRFMRAAGSFGQPNPFGGYLGLTLPVMISVLSWFSVRPIRKRRLSWGDFVGWSIVRGLVPIVAGGLLASWSRGAWLGAVVAVGIVMWLSSTRLIRIIAFLMITIALLIGAAAPLIDLIPPEIAARFSDVPLQLGLGASIDAEITDENFAILERLAFWMAALQMWESAPWLGIGPGNFDAVYSLYNIPRWPMSLGHAHNIYLNNLAESGILGFSTFLILWISVVVTAFRSFQESRRRNRWQAALSVGVLGIVAHLAVHSFFDNLFVQGMFLHLSLWIAILLTLERSSDKHEHLGK